MKFTECPAVPWMFVGCCTGVSAVEERGLKRCPCWWSPPIHDELHWLVLDGRSKYVTVAIGCSVVRGESACCQLPSCILSLSGGQSSSQDHHQLGMLAFVCLRKEPISLSAPIGAVGTGVQTGIITQTYLAAIARVAERRPRSRQLVGR